LKTEGAQWNDSSDGSTRDPRSRHGWGGKEGGIAGVSRGACRLFLTDESFRAGRGNQPPVVTWLNLDGKAEVDALHQDWQATSATILAPPESKPWRLHEFMAADMDGNVLRVFYDFSRDI
jgi:uncharacterized glyoxalase superfamily protein PhnB